MASNRPLDPRRLDVEAFAEQAQTLDGQWPLTALARLAEGAGPDGVVAWRLSGERRARLGAEPQTRLRIEAGARVPMQCQRCLQPVHVEVTVDHWLLFVAGGEAAAAALDADSEEDVLPLQRSVDAQALVEDELLLTLPIVPRHEVCPQPLPLSGDDAAAPDDAGEVVNPFAVLGRLKNPQGDH